MQKPERYPFSASQWIGLRAGECPSADSVAQGRDFAEVQAEYLAHGGHTVQNSVLFRREIEITRHVRRAIARTVGLGFYEFYLNGKKVGDRLLTPHTTEFNKKILYDIYDVTDLLLPGRNAVGYELAGGWFSPDPKFCDWRFTFYGTPRLILSLTLEYYDGTREEIVSGPEFRLHDGAVLSASIYAGEEYDARRELPGWASVGFDDSDWLPAQTVEGPGGVLTENDCPPIREIAAAAPTRFWAVEEDGIGYAFAENLIGWLRVRLKGPRGASIQLNHSENLNDDGTLDAMTNRGANNEDVYILKGGEETEVFEPRFIWHNFQYALLTKSDPSIEILSVEQVNVRSDVRITGRFVTSDPALNLLHEQFLRSELDCLMGVPIDCPQRDERLGWMGDAYITGETCLYNLDMRTLYRNFLRDIRLTQTAEGNVAHICPWPRIQPCFDWTAGYVILMDYIYRYEGDDALFAEYFDSMLAFQRYVRSTGEDYDIPKGRNGDWMCTLPGFVRGDPESLTPMLFYWITRILHDGALRLGRAEAATALAEDLAGSRRTILAKYYDADGRHFLPNTQCSNALGYLLGLYPEGEGEAVISALIDGIRANGGCFTTGILGTKFVLEALQMADRQEEIYALWMQEKYPSWRELLRGRSTLPEKWDGGGSGCHAMFDTGDSYFYTALAGIRINFTDPDPISFRPWLCSTLDFVRASVGTSLGDVSCEWMREGENIIITVSVPQGQVARFDVHPDYADRIVCINGRRSLERSFRLHGGEHTIYVTDDPRYVRYNL